MYRTLVPTLCAALVVSAPVAAAPPEDDPASPEDNAASPEADAPEPEPQKDATAHFEAAAQLYAREDYEGAAEEFSIAYALEPSVEIKFAWAQAERLAGDLEQAERLYLQLLDDE